MHRMESGGNEAVRNYTQETITRHVSDRSYDFSLRLARIMHSRPLTAKQVLRSNVDTSSNASADKHRLISLQLDSRFRPLSWAKLLVWKVKHVPRGSSHCASRCVNNASARKISCHDVSSSNMSFFYFSRRLAGIVTTSPQVNFGTDALFALYKIVIRERDVSFTDSWRQKSRDEVTPLVIDVKEPNRCRVVVQVGPKGDSYKFPRRNFGEDTTGNFRPLAFSIYRFVERSR